MFCSLIVLIYYHHHLLLHVSASSLLFTLNDVRYSLSDRVLTIPKLGSIRGIHIDYESNYSQRYNLVNTEAFLGIQYGLYHGRFEPSKERFNVHPSTKVNKQIESGPACPQFIWRNASELSRIRPSNFVRDYYPKLLKYILKQSEEQCLYMNIYQPQIKDLNERLPVLLFVHGDGYDMSTGGAFDGAIFASYTKTIVVTINYRLGPFGFLYVSREHKGDYALQDIYTALHWLKNYVTNFNGDPDRITLYGTGTGAVLASLVAMLETVNGGTGTVKRRKALVHRLILNDQTFLSPHMTTTLQEISSSQSSILSHLACSTSQCLRNQSLITTDDLLRLNIYSDANGDIRPLESPFPFYHSSSSTDRYSNPLRSRFFQQAHALLPENLRVLLTASTSTFVLPSDMQHPHTNSTIEYLFNYAYTKWNETTHQFDFDQQLLSYHQQIIAPLLQYAKHLANQTKPHLLERHAEKYPSELPLTFGYVLAPSMSVYNDTYLSAEENDRIESMSMMDLFANLIHNGDINILSPYCNRVQSKQNEKWHPVFPELNLLLLKDGKLTQRTGQHAQAHYLLNHLISNLSTYPDHLDLLNTWVSLYEVSHPHNRSHQRSSPIRSSLLTRSLYSDGKHPKYVFVITCSVFLLLLLNCMLCITLAKRGRCFRKREYNCLNGHAQLNIEKIPPQHGSSSPSSTTSNGTIIQQLTVNTNCTTTTNSSLTSTPPVDIIHPINVTKKNGILRSSSKPKPAVLPEAIV